MNQYFSELCRAMELLATQPDTVFMGQAVEFPGTGMHASLKGRANLLELPVAEDMQMGMAIGMSLAGMLPVCIYPRVNFLLLAINQLVLHLDKLPRFSGYRPKVIIRTAVATPEPLDPGPQHLGDFTPVLHLLLDTVRVVRLDHSRQIMPAYQAAIARPQSTLLIERAEFYA